MVLLFMLFVLFLKTSCIYSWLPRKCVMYIVEDLAFLASCSEKTNTAICDHITDINEDLHGLPTNLQSLCIQLDSDIHYAVILAPGSFSNFSSLEYLKITGCFSKISPDAFAGLLNLTSLRLESNTKGCCEASVEFSGLTSLKNLYLSQYSLILMAQNVFDSIPQLEILSISNACLKDLSEVLCRLKNVKSLKLFYLSDTDLNVLQFPNCSFFNTSDSQTPTVYNIEKIDLYLGSVKHIDEGALKVFGNLWDLGFGGFLRDLSLMGVNHIYSLTFSVDVLNIDELCYAAKLYSIKFIFVSYTTINFPATPTNISKDCKEVVGIHLYQYVYNAFKIDSIFHIFSNLSKLTVHSYVLRSNDFKSVCLSFPQSVKQLSIMSLMSNVIGKIISHQFFCFKNLESLDLYSTNISSIEDFSFTGLDKLKDLNLCRNKLSRIYQDTFSGLYELMFLDLQENPLIQIESNSFGHLTNLHTLLLGDLHYPPNISQIKLRLSDIFGRIPYNLSNVFISSGMRPMQLMFGDVTLNRSLHLQIKGQYVTVEDCDSPLLTSVVTLQINAEYVLCGKDFIGKYVKSVVKLEFISVFSDNIGDLSVINELVHLTKLKLENIDLSKQPNVQIMFHNLTKLLTLMLTNCRIFFLDGSLTKDLKALTGLVFTTQSYVNILQNFVEHLTSLKELRIYGIHLHCSCDDAWLVSWVKDNKQVQVIMFNPTMKELQCVTENGIDFVNFVHFVQDNCSFHIEFVLFASTSAFLYLFIFVALSYRLAGQYIKPLYHISRGWFREAVHKDGKQQYRYDVFVSYSSKDECWVMEELLPNLEQRGPPFLRLCLHSRDFQLGQDIVENITDSIYASRRTLCLVSRNYIHSSWCSLEMQLGTYRLQVEQRDILILVFLENIPSRLLSCHHRLARLVKTRTYLDWPLDPEMHKAFWERLWNKLSTDKYNSSL
ncbi:toll-like receptor 13 [Triplophysa rosa]|uniref:Toll-like receptor 20 n=1 Tax=Triplophysa rosa TaxID=992332 RepID=A0A977J5Y9_TRIRA|nr:toll-like receptor 13 [Triplophysa rosa]KAI7808871.1 toll-like receptor 20 [Triplophysa rosa]UWV86662.1 Toll-like receptor 20 [Triplophysa rosa]